MRYYFLLSGEPIDDTKLTALLKIVSPGKKFDREKITAIADFINASSEGAVVQSALCFALLSQLLPQNNDNIKISTIISEIYAMNQGYDLRGVFDLQEFFFSDLLNLKKKLKSAQDTKNLSGVVEFYVQGFSIQAEKARVALKKGIEPSMVPAAFKKLSERQVKILGLFSFPDARVSNKTVQKEFGVSQVTASRDLAKLAALGLLFPKGRGRSVNYVKI